MRINGMLIRKIEAVKMAGLTAVGRTVYQLTRVFFLTLLFLPVSIPLFLVMRAIKPWLLIRLHPLYSSRLGHFAGNTELYLCEKDFHINTPVFRYVDLSYFASIYICNKQLAKMWRRHLTIWPAWLLDPIFRLNRLFPGAAAHEVGDNANQDRDVNNLMEKVAPHLYFTASERRKGAACLLELGIPEGAKYICLIGRDNLYLKTVVNPGGNFGYHDYRNVKIENFLPAAHALADEGYYVIRMGKIVASPFKSENPKIIDYASSKLRNDFMDIYLGANCFFCIGVGSGFDEVPKLFRRPVCYVNMVPIGYLCTFSKNSVAICKKHWLTTEQRWLSLSEIFSRDVGFCLFAEEYQARKVEVVENTAEEIKSLVLEMSARLNNKWEVKPEDIDLQRRFWSIYPSDARDKYLNRPLHGSINMLFGAEFLRKNADWLS